MIFDLLFALLVAVVLVLVEVVEGDLPDAGEKDLGAVADLGYATWQIATFLTSLQGLVDVDDLLETLAEVAGPHLIFDVFVPHARVDYCFALHAARDLVQDVALACILCQVVSKFVFENFKENDLLLLHIALI